MRRTLPAVVSVLLTIAVVVALDTRIGMVPALGRFLSPHHGFWRNAEAADHRPEGLIALDGLREPVDIAFDGNLVPHVFARNDDDLYFAQGYLHAMHRLFQMDMQTRLAAGRLSEVVGPRALRLDRQQRRLGMVYAAEQALLEVERDPTSKRMFDAYTSGVNAYLSTLQPSQFPIEYKLLDFEPEPWTNLRSALMLKLMAKRLASDNDRDLAYTNAARMFTQEELELLYPQIHDSLQPILPKGTAFPAPSIVPVAPAKRVALPLADTIPSSAATIDAVDPNTGSNNWVVAGSRTASGYPILCDDPHLELTLPSIWYEVQLSTPSSNCYGVSLPGCPFVIIGFTDDIAWGVTNAQRDVKDYYAIRFKDASKQHYASNGSWKPATIRLEQISVKGQGVYTDTVAWTEYGPVMYDDTFIDSAQGRLTLAVRWAAHDPSNEGLTFYKLNRSRTYADFVDAIASFQCPGQNFVFASHAGDIALWQQGRFPARWKGQGIGVMPGDDTGHRWQGFIPPWENPHALNPPRGYLHSANQRPADDRYPYYIPGDYITQRGIALEQQLQRASSVTTRAMMRLQNDVFNVTAQDVLPMLLQHVRIEELTKQARRYLAVVRDWDLQATAESVGQTVYDRWWDSVQVALWHDEFDRLGGLVAWPKEQTTLEMLIRDPNVRYIDDNGTPQMETLSDVVTAALNAAARTLGQDEQQGRLAWGRWKNTTVYHLLKDALPAFARSGLNVGGDGNMINAAQHSHGPSWRMVVHMKRPVEAYGIFPGGQSGNPGSRFYDNNIEAWARGRYNRLWFMDRSQIHDPRVMSRMRLEVCT